MNKILTKEDVFNFLSKNPNLRSLQEIHVYGEYLSKNYNYFAKLQAEDSQLKVEKLAKVCKLEKNFKGESIINYGEIGDKFYIVLEGVVEIFKPKYVEINVTPSEFMGTLYKMREMDGNDLRFNRIKEKNNTFFESIEGRKNIDPVLGYRFMKFKQVFIMEEEEKMGEYGEGFSFGDIALMKRTARNATIKAKENCILLTIEKNDYNKAIMEFQKKKLGKEIDIFVQTYSFFKNFSGDRIINLFNCFTRRELFKGDYLYKQNMEDDFIYILNSGTLSIFSLISFSWINHYINYINYSGKNIIQYMLKNRGIKIGDLLKVVQNCQSKIVSIPINEEKYELWEKIIEKQMKDNLYKLKKDEEKLNDPEYIFNINLKKINHNEIIGLEEVFEFKKRFCNCKCISDKAELKAIKIIDLLKLIVNFGEEELGYLLHIINERKMVLKNQIIKGIENLDKKLIFKFDLRYENIIMDSNEKKTNNNEEKLNTIISTIKMKGYKNTIKDILDFEVPVLEKEKNKTNYNNFLKLGKNKSSENLMNSLNIKLKTNNEFKLKKTNTIFGFNSCKEMKDNSNNNINNIYNLLNKSQMKTLNDTLNIYNKYNNKITSNSYINKTKYTNDSFQSELIKRKRLNSSMYNNEKNNNTNENDKLNSGSPIIKNNKYQKLKIKKWNRVSSTPNFLNKKHAMRKTLRDTITPYESYNLPKINKKNFYLKNNLDKKGNNSQIIINGNKDYKNFYNIYNEDKNFYLGVEFNKKVSKDFKYIPLNKNSLYKKILKKE